MSNENTTQVTENVSEVVEAAVPVVKTKKELRKERKEIKKHKKQVAKEARMHTSKMTRFNNFLISLLSIIVIVVMIVCSVNVVSITKSFTSASTAASDNVSENANSNTTTTTGNNTNTNNNANTNTNTDTNTDANTATPDDSGSTNAEDSGNASTGAEDSGNASTGAASGDLSTKEGVVEYYKTAHAKVLAEAKSATRTYDNTTNYNEYLEVGGNSTLAGVAKTLMGMFMKENTEQLSYSGADIATNFPPTKNSCAGLTADMISDYSCKEEGDNYIITLTLNSSESAPDLGDNAAHLVSIVESKTVEEAAAGFVSFSGLRNEYIAPTVTATINKTTGQMTDLHILTPSYMKFDKATVAVIVNVENVGIGLQYEQKWTVEW